MSKQSTHDKQGLKNGLRTTQIYSCHQSCSKFIRIRQTVCHTKLKLSFNLISPFIVKVPMKIAPKCKTVKTNDTISRINHLLINLSVYRKLHLTVHWKLYNFCFSLKRCSYVMNLFCWVSKYSLKKKREQQQYYTMLYKKKSWSN